MKTLTLASVPVVTFLKGENSYSFSNFSSVTETYADGNWSLKITSNVPLFFIEDNLDDLSYNPIKIDWILKNTDNPVEKYSHSYLYYDWDLKGVYRRINKDDIKENIYELTSSKRILVNII